MQLPVRGYRFQTLEAEEESGRIHMRGVPGYILLEEKCADTQVDATSHDAALKAAMQRQ
jgi:hypothetical protein